MRTPVSITGALVAILTLHGCLSDPQPVRTIAEIENDLAMTRARKNTLEQEVKSLRDLNDKLAEDAESLSAELMTLRRNREGERARFRDTLTGLDSKRKTSTTSQVLKAPVPLQ